MKLQLKLHLFRNSNILILAILSLSGCLKTVESDSKSYFLRGVIINDYAPVFDLYLCNYQGEQKLNYNLYELEISTSNTSEKMVNGNFSSIKGKPNTEYKIRWKLVGSSDWNEIIEFIPNPDTMLLNKSRLINDGNSISINSVKENDSFTFCLSFFSELNKNKYKTFASYYSPLSPNISTAQYYRPIIENKSEFVQLYNEKERLVIWPPRKSENPFWLNFNPCLKPFNARPVNGVKFEDFYLFMIEKKDVETYRNLYLNDKNSEGPLFVGDPINFDYQNNNQYAQILTMYRFENIQLKHAIRFSDTATFELQYKGSAIDTGLIKIENVGLQLRDVKQNITALDSKKPAGHYFHKDLIASTYNLDMGPCGEYKKEYWFRPVITFSLRATGKTQYFFGDFVKYENSPTKYIININ